MLYLAAIRSISLQGSAFGAYYQHLVARGLEEMSALMAVMRKMVAVATHLMQTGEDYDPGKVWVGLRARSPYPAWDHTQGGCSVQGSRERGLLSFRAQLPPWALTRGLTNLMASSQHVGSMIASLFTASVHSALHRIITMLVVILTSSSRKLRDNSWHPYSSVA